MTKSKRGFASMTPERRKEVARLGGQTAHKNGTAHEWTPDEAREAGIKGGTTVSQDKDHMAEIGRIPKGSRKRKGKQKSRAHELLEILTLKD